MGTSYSGPANAVAIGSPAVSVTGTPSAGQVPVATDTTDATWQTPASATVSSVFGRTGAVTAASGDYTASQVTGAVSSVTAADASVTVGGTATAPTVSTGTLAQIATAHPNVADIPMNVHKLANLANGTTAGDSLAYGQGVTGDLSGTLPSPTVAKIQGHAISSAEAALVAAGTVPGTILVAPVVYAPASNPAYAISTSALTKIDTTNLVTGAFNVPASGNYKVKLEGWVTGGILLGTARFGLIDASGGTQRGNSSIVYQDADANAGVHVTLAIYVIGDTPAAGRNLAWAALANNTGFTLNGDNATGSAGTFGPLTMEVVAL